MTDILRSTFPVQAALPAYKVSIELLKYPHSFEEIEHVDSLLRDSCGEWARIGVAMDTWKAQAAGLFDVKFIRDCTAFASLLPGLNRILYTTNRWMIPYSKKSIPRNLYYWSASLRRREDNNSFTQRACNTDHGSIYRE